MATVFRAGDVEMLALPGRRSRAVVSDRRGAAQVSFRIVEIDPLKPGEAERGPHVHRAFEECIHVLAGTGVMKTAAAELPVAAGDTVLVPPGELHATRATGQGTLTLLCFFPVGDVASGTKEFASWDAARGAA